MAVQKQTIGPAQGLPSFGRVTKAEAGVIWALVNRPEEGLAALEGLQQADFEGLAARSVLDLARKLNDDKGFSPSALFERLSTGDAQLVAAIASEPEPPAELHSCAIEIRRARCQRERTTVQGEIDRLLTSGATDSPELNELLVRDLDLRRLIEDLVSSED
jgi:hypothetical protein